MNRAEDVNRELDPELVAWIADVTGTDTLAITSAVAREDRWMTASEATVR